MPHVLGIGLDGSQTQEEMERVLAICGVFAVICFLSCGVEAAREALVHLLPLHKHDKLFSQP